MKITRSSQSAYIPIRLVIALALCLAGVSLAGQAFGSWEGVSLVRWVNAQRESLLETKLKVSRRGGGKSPAWGTSIPAKANTSNGTQTSASANQILDSTVTQHVNALGQTVFSVRTSHFDVSPPLSELAKLSIPEPPRTE